MKILSIGLFLIIILLSFNQVQAQSWVEKMNDRSTNFYTAQQDFNATWGNQPYVRGNGWKQYKRWEAFWEPRVYPHGVRPSSDFAWKEHLKFQRTYPSSTQTTSRSANWTPMGPNSWVNQAYNPGNGRVNVVVEDPNNSSILYVGTPAGGCWKSTTGGASWTPLTDHLQTLGVSAIAIDYVNTNILYIGTGDDDAGDTYSIGVFKSMDAGTTWSEVTPNSAAIFGSRIYKMMLHPTDNNTLFVASTTGCHKSIDGGNTWVLLRSGTWRDMELKPNDPNTIYLANKTFFRSTNGGLSWSQITTGLPNATAINRAEIAVSAANPDYIYFLCGNVSNSSFYGLYRSDNAGVSFTLRANTPNIFAYDLIGGNTTDGQSWYDMGIAVSPTDAEEVYTGGINVWKSLDGGSTHTIKSYWVNPSTIAYTHADIHTLEMIGNRLYCGSDGGLFKSTNGANSFQNISTGLSISQFYRIGGSEQAPNKVIGGTQDNGCNLVENFVSKHINGGDGMEAFIAPNDSLRLFVSSQNGGFQYSNDGGFSFDPIFLTQNGNGAWVTPMVINPLDNDMLLAGFDQVYMSLSSGLSDNVISSFNLGGSLLQNLAISPSDGYTHFYAGTYNQLYGTSNGSGTWNNITAGLPNVAMSSITVHPTDPLKIWVTLSGTSAGQKVYTSSNGGATWTNISANLPNIPINCMVYQNGSANALYIGTDIGVYYHDDLLAGWQQYMTGLPNVIVNDLDINYAIGKIRAGTFGRGIWESNLKPPVTTRPIANFGHTSTQICPSDSIQFTDTSTDNAPSWVWSFPGGSPSSSTAQNPMVAYPASGVYTATLIVQNTFGADTISQTIAVSHQPNVLGFNIQLDSLASEVYWTIKDNAGSIVYNSLPFALSNQNDQLVQTPVCLSPGCYTLYMMDLGANGLCCSNGAGYYLLTDQNGDTLAFGGNYADADTVAFCVNQTSPMAMGTSILDAECGRNNGQVVVTAVGGDGNYMYSFNGAAATTIDTFSNLSAGTYAITVTDGLGQQVSSNVVINVIGTPLAIASASATTIYMNQGGLANFFSTNSSNAGSYLWTFPGGSTSTLANPNFTFTTDGVQQVILRVNNFSCNDYDTLNINVINNVAIDQISNDANISIAPNPVQDKFSLNISFLQTQELVEVVIHNALGQRVYWKEIQHIKNYNEQINLGNEADGIYIITVLSKGIAVSKKFVVSR